MRPAFVFLFLTVLLSGFLAFHADAQEAEQVYVKGRRYLDLNIHAIDKYAARLERTQKNLLGKLKRKEQRLEKRFLRKDSVLYARYKASNTISYDSISKLAATPPDSATLAARLFHSGNKTIDTLKRVYGFVQSKASSLTSAAGSTAGAAGLEGYSGQLSSLQGRLSYDQYLSELTNQRTTNLESIAGNDPTVTGMQKQLYYAKSKIAEWKKIADEPTKAEELALEYLQGTKGFSLNNIAEGGVGSGATTGSGGLNADDLEKLGYQTKRQVMAGLQQKYGSSLGSMQTNLTKEVSDWQDKAQSLSAQVKETKQSLQGLRHTEKPKFRINPMRGLPFWKRIEKQYGFNTTRAAANPDGSPRPAMLSLSAGAAYRQTPKLSAGVALAGDMGLGQNWSQIRFSFEGLTARSFVTWQWQYGIGAYGGYERTWKQAAFQANPENNAPSLTPSVHNREGYSEAVLLGLTKSYKVNSKWNGQIQLLYDIWWQEKALRSPIVLRFITISNNY